MTARYLGSEEWELFFDDRKRVVLSTHNIEELVEQSEDILYNPNNTEEEADEKK
jgi:hypothetical protein